MTIGWVDYMNAHKNDRTIHTINSVLITREDGYIHVSLKDFLKELKLAASYARNRKINNAVGKNIFVDCDTDEQGEMILRISGEFPADKTFVRKQYQQSLDHLKGSAKNAGFKLVPLKK